MVLSGEGQDKAATNAIADFVGVGINLEARQPGPEKIRNAVRKILEQEQYRTKVNALSQKYEKYDVSRDFDRLVQDVVRKWKRMPAWKGEL